MTREFVHNFTGFLLFYFSKTTNKMKASFQTKYLVITLLLAFCSKINAQNSNLYMPLEVQKSYKAQIRNLDGTVGKNYWQNRVKYKIKAEFRPDSGIIKGTETIVFYNKTGERLHNIVLNLYPDLYRKGNMRKREVNPLDVNNGVYIKALSVNDNEPTYYIEETLMTINQGVEDKDSVKIRIDWQSAMPRETKIRIGTYDSTTYFVGYWYPQIVVYDYLNSWDKKSYDGLHEFYQEFADYDVEITVPDRQMVWATGILQNPKDVLSASVYEKYVKASTSDEIIQVVSKDDRLSNEKVTQQKGKNTWHFKAENVLDFAFATSGHYVWDATSLVINQKRVMVNAVYGENNKYFNGFYFSKSQ